MRSITVFAIVSGLAACGGGVADTMAIPGLQQISPNTIQENQVGYIRLALTLDSPDEEIVVQWTTEGVPDNTLYFYAGAPIYSNSLSESPNEAFIRNASNFGEQLHLSKTRSTKLYYLCAHRPFTAGTVTFSFPDYPDADPVAWSIDCVPPGVL